MFYHAPILARASRIAVLIALAAGLLAGLPARAQATIWNLRATDIGSRSVAIKWEKGQGSDNSLIYIGRIGRDQRFAGNTTEASFRINNLRPRTRYVISVYHDHRVLEITVRTESSDGNDETRHAPPPVKCPFLPPGVVVSGFVENTLCQMTGDVVISGYPDLRQRGFIDAVDLWYFVNGGLEVCFRSDGWLVFLDATHMLRAATELEHSHRDGMTCGSIDRAGTVVLLRDAPPSAPPQGGDALPTFDSIAQADCQIKLEETLFLRAEPAGEIIGLVWLNSEVPVFEISGDWYRTEFEGQAGYISRFYRRVLRGGCI